MAIVSALCNSYKNDLIGGVTQHASGDTYKIALYTTSRATLDKTTTVYDTTNEVPNGNGYTTGGATLAGFNVTQIGDKFVLIFTPDPSWTSSTLANVGGALIYNSSKSNKAIAAFNLGTLNTTNGTLLIDLGNVSVVSGSITFTTGTNTITRASGDFTADGFKVGQTIFTDDTANPGPLTLATVGTTTMTTTEAISSVAQATKTIRAAVIAI